MHYSRRSAVHVQKIELIKKLREEKVKVFADGDEIKSEPGKHSFVFNQTAVDDIQFMPSMVVHYIPYACLPAPPKRKVSGSQKEKLFVKQT